jgi:hypothetical protein
VKVERDAGEKRKFEVLKRIINDFDARIHPIHDPDELHKIMEYEI